MMFAHVSAQDRAGGYESNLAPGVGEACPHASRFALGVTAPPTRFAFRHVSSCFVNCLPQFRIWQLTKQRLDVIEQGGQRHVANVHADPILSERDCAERLRLLRSVR